MIECRQGGLYDVCTLIREIRKMIGGFYAVK